MIGKVGVLKVMKEVFVVVEEEVDRLIKEGGGWDDVLCMFVDVGDLIIGLSLVWNDWYRLCWVFEIIKVF